MNNRIVTWAAVACLSAYASAAGAVALGEVRALSALGEPLQLKLALTDLAAVNPADVRVTLAPADDYSRLGLIPPLGAEQWRVSMLSGNGLSALISGDAIEQDPNLSFLVQVLWPGNITVQQVTAVLLPAAPATTQPLMTAPELPSAMPISTVVPAGTATVSVPTEATTPVPDAPLKPAAIEQIVAEPVTAHIQAGDTLSQLAKAWGLPQASLLQRQQVLAENNPQVFVAGNINQLKRGAIIRYPLANGLTLPDAAQAAAWLASRQSAVTQDVDAALDQPALSSQPAVAGADADQEVTLTLVTPGTAKTSEIASADEVEAADQLGVLTTQKNTLLAERAALQAELAALEKSGSKQDSRLKVLDARLAQLNAPDAVAKPSPVDGKDTANTSRPIWVAIAVGAFLAFLLVMRRRAAAASAAAKAKAAPVLPENDYVVFEPLEALPMPVPVPVPAANAEQAADDDEEYDFLSDAESAALQTRLDLAQAYIDMQETELAKELLLTVLSRGSTEQRAQAAAILDSLA